MAVVMVLVVILSSMPVAFGVSSKYGDVDGDGDISVIDGTSIQMCVAKMIDSFPVESQPTEPPTVYTLETFIHDIEVAAGVNLQYKREFTDNRYGLFVEYHSGKNRVAVCWDEELNIPSCIYLNSAKYDPTDEWFKIKDAMLEHPVFDWTADEVSSVKGKISVMYSKELYPGSYRCYIGQAVNAALIIEYKG